MALEETKETSIMSFYFDEKSPSGVGFETIEELVNSEQTLRIALNLATRISDRLSEEAKKIMYVENVPLFRIFTDNKGFWGEWCSIDELDVDEEMNGLLQSIGRDLEGSAKQ